MLFFFFSSRRRHTRCALVTGVQTCALPIYLIDLGANPGAFEPFNFNPYNLLQAPNEQWTATVLANYEISDSLEFYGRGSWAKSKVTTIVAPTGTFFFPFDINYLDNPFLSAQARGVFAGFDLDDPTTPANEARSEEHTSELQSLMRISYAVF